MDGGAAAKKISAARSLAGKDRDNNFKHALSASRSKRERLNKPPFDGSRGAYAQILTREALTHKTLSGTGLWEPWGGNAPGPPGPTLVEGGRSLPSVLSTGASSISGQLTQDTPSLVISAICVRDSGRFVMSQSAPAILCTQSGIPGLANLSAHLASVGATERTMCNSPIAARFRADMRPESQPTGAASCTGRLHRSHHLRSLRSSCE